jgi:hypothetical protein
MAVGRHHMPSGLDNRPAGPESSVAIMSPLTCLQVRCPLFDDTALHLHGVAYMHTPGISAYTRCHLLELTPPPAACVLAEGGPTKTPWQQQQHLPTRLQPTCRAQHPRWDDNRLTAAVQRRAGVCAAYRRQTPMPLHAHICARTHTHTHTTYALPPCDAAHYPTCRPRSCPSRPCAGVSCPPSPPAPRRRLASRLGDRTRAARRKRK